MGGRNGGTEMYCAECKKVTICSAIPLRHLNRDSGQRFYSEQHPDINWFRRGRKCLTCYGSVTTAELDEAFLHELMELREALKDIRAHAERYQSEAGAASKSLEQLTKSLEVLKALH
jgi:hypothetical protein